MMTEKRLTPDFKKLTKSMISGQRTAHKITFTPNSANPGKKYI